MQHRVKCLVDRLATPHIALRLRKEEVCLALGALGKLGMPHATEGGGHAVVEGTMLRQRMQQFVPSCSALELGLLAGGCTSMRWMDAGLADQFMARVLAVGSTQSQGGRAPPPMSFESAGPLLLASASIAWRERSLASERCALFLARQDIALGKSASTGDSDQLASAVTGAVVLSLHAASAASSSNSPPVFSIDELLHLVRVLSTNCHAFSDVGVGLSILTCVLVISSFPECSPTIVPSLLGFIRRAESITTENLSSSAPSVLALAAMRFVPQCTDSCALQSSLMKVLRASVDLSQPENATTPVYRNDEILSSLVCVASFLHLGADAEESALLSHFLQASCGYTGSLQMPPLAVSVLTVVRKMVSESNSLVSAMLGHVDQLGRLLDMNDAPKAVEVSRRPSATLQSLRDAAFALLVRPSEAIPAAQMIAGLQAARLGNVRDPVLLQSVIEHIQFVIASRDSSTAKTILSSLGSDLTTLGVSESHRSSLLSLSQQMDSATGDAVDVSLPMQFKLLRSRGEAVSDALLMSVLEAIEDWSAGDIAYFVAAAPDKCVEFDMLVEKLSSGLEELNAEQLACVLDAVAASPALAATLHDASLAQTAEIAERIGLDAPPMIASLVRLFVNTYTLSSGDSCVQQREELRNLIHQATGSMLAMMHAADIQTTCAAIKAFRDCPSLGSLAVDVCCEHLLTFVQREGSCEFHDLIDILMAMAAVDTVSPQLVDAVVPRFEEVLRNSDQADPDHISQFLDACVALDTPELDTLFQLCLGDLIAKAVSDSSSSLVVSHLGSALGAALSIGHRPGVSSVLARLCADTDGMAVSPQLFNSIIGKLSSSEGRSISDLLCADTLPSSLKPEDLSLLCQQLMENASSLATDESGGGISFSNLFVAIRNLTLVGDYHRGEGIAVRPAIPLPVIDACIERIDSLSGADVAHLICGLPYVDLDRSDTAVLLQILITRLSHECHTCDPTLLSNAVFSLGELDNRIGLHITHHVAVDKMSDYCVDNVASWTSGRSICKLLYGFSRVACNKRSLFNVFGTQLGKRPLLMLLSREDVSLAMSAFGNAKYLDKELYDAMAEHMVTIVDDLNPADLTLVLTGYSRLNLLNRGLYSSLGDRVASIAEQMPTGASARILCAFGHVGTSHDVMAGSLLTNIAMHTDRLSANECADTLYGVSLMSHGADSDHLDALAARIADDKDALSCSAIAKVCEVMQHLNWRNDDLLRAIADRSVSVQLSESTDDGSAALAPETARSVLDTLGFFMVHHKSARLHLTDAARTISRDPSIVAELLATGGSASASQISE